MATNVEIREQVLALRGQGLTYQKISDQLNIDRSYAYRVCRGKEKAHPRSRIADIPVLPKLNSNLGSRELGSVTELMVTVKLISLGFDVWHPSTNNHRSDIGVYHSGKLAKCQIKTATYDKKNRRFRAVLGTRNRNGDHVKYADGEFDFFIVRCPEAEAIYVFPFDFFGKLGTVNLYPDRVKLMFRGNEVESYKDGFSLIHGYLNRGV